MCSDPVYTKNHNETTHAVDRFDLYLIVEMLSDLAIIRPAAPRFNGNNETNK